MTSYSWQLTSPISAIAFDCDGTLSTIEGIDELAKKNNLYETVSTLTAEAMGKTGLTPALYEARLNLIKPRREQVEALAEAYLAHQVTDAQLVIQLLNRLKKSVYLISAGLYPAVKQFGEKLTIPADHIFAVNIQFDEANNYLSYEKTSPLTGNNGKREIVAKLKDKHAEIAYIGDGLNDISVYDIVTRFIGYGGVFPRENIAARCEYYIRTRSLAALLPLILTTGEYSSLYESEKKLYQKGLDAIHLGLVVK